MNSTEPPETGPAGRRRVVRSHLEDVRADPMLGGLTAALQRVCRAATEALALRGASVHLMTTAGSTGVVASSDAESRAVAELQFATNEGPALVAFHTQRPALVPDLGQVLDRWPGFSSSAVSGGVRALFAFPLQEGAVSFGVLELYADRAGPLDPDALALGAAFARAATELLLDGGAVTSVGELDAGLTLSFLERARIHQAQGMLMVELRVSLGEALTRMRARAFSSGSTLLDVADQVLAGSLPPDTWADGYAAPDGSRS